MTESDMTTKSDASGRVRNGEVSRRRFLQSSAAVSAAAAACPAILKSAHAQDSAITSTPDPAWTETDVVRTVCQMCHGRCGLQVRVKDGVIVKIDGNPYHPNNLEPDERPPYATDPNQLNDSTYPARGRVCAKPQAAVETIYDPWRVVQPLRRVGPRGSGAWTTITWAEAIEEMRAHAQPLYDSSDPDDWNRFVFVPGRFPHGMKEFTDRWFGKGFGTINKRHDHTSICETSHHVGNKLCTGNTYPTTDGKGDKDHFKPDLKNAEFVIFFGTSPYEANFPMNSLARKLSNAKAAGGLTFAVVDPRMNNSAGKADKWVPIIPGTDGALAMAMVQMILDNELFDETFLTNANFKASQDDLEATWTDSSHLFVTEAVSAGSNPTEYPAIKKGTVLRRRHLQGESVGAKDNRVCVTLGSGFEGDFAYNDPEVTIFDPVSTTTAAEGEIFFEGTITGADGRVIPVRSSLEQVWNAANEYSLAEYSEICGVSLSDITWLVTNLTGHGKRAGVQFYRGPVQNTNGTWNAMALTYLNMLIGNIDYAGGVTTGGGYLHEDGSEKPLQLVLANVDAAKSPRTAQGVPITRVGKKYEDFAANFGNEWPARRPWFPFALNGNYQEILPSIADQYPYGVEFLMTYWAAIPYSTPAAKAQAEQVLADTNLVPYFVAVDTQIGELSKWADLILPDPTWLEYFATPHPTPTILTKIAALRQPVTSTYVEANGTRYYTAFNAVGNVALDPSGAEGPQMIYDVLIALGKALSSDFAAIGNNTFPEYLKDGTTPTSSNPNFTRNLNSAWDWIRNCMANHIVESGVGGLNFDTLLQKGGWFEDPGLEYKTVSGRNYVARPYGDLPGQTGHKRGMFFYVEALATTKDSMGDGTQTLNPRGVAFYEPVTTMEMDGDGEHVLYESYDSAFPLKLVTYKAAFHAQARTNVNPSLLMLMPENFVEMAKSDADSLGIRTGDLVELESANGSVIGRALVLEGQLPGVVAVAHSYGHWEAGAVDQVIDGTTIDADASRGTGITANPIMRVDPWCEATGAAPVTLQDRVGGSCAFYATKVRVTRL